MKCQYAITGRRTRYAAHIFDFTASRAYSQVAKVVYWLLILIYAISFIERVVKFRTKTVRKMPKLFTGSLLFDCQGWINRGVDISMKPKISLIY